MHKLVSVHGMEYPAFVVEIQHSANELRDNPLSLFILRERVDYDSRRLSLLFPGGRIVVSCMRRVKAVYEGGNRVFVTNYRDHYHNLTDDEYHNTQIFCSESHEYI